MNPTPTPQTSGHRFPFGSGHHVMGDRTIYVTLAVLTVIGLLVILLEYYAVQHRNPINRIGFGFFMSLMPALGAFVVLKLTSYFESWKGAAIVYVALLILIMIIQAFTRMVPITG